MKLYLLFRPADLPARKGEFGMAVVIAPNAKEVVNVHPNGYLYYNPSWPDKPDWHETWIPVERVLTKQIGTADPDLWLNKKYINRVILAQVVVA